MTPSDNISKLMANIDLISLSINCLLQIGFNSVPRLDWNGKTKAAMALDLVIIVIPYCYSSFFAVSNPAAELCTGN